MKAIFRTTKSRTSATVFTACVLFLILYSRNTIGAPTDRSFDDALSPAVCPIVYPVDESPSRRGYQYTFWGNGFFINKQGYLLTAAHVLSAFRNGGGTPRVLVNRRSAPPELLSADMIATDWDHDVALLRAKPNPFEGRYKVAFLPLSAGPLPLGQTVLALASHPPKNQGAHTFDMPLQDRYSGQVLNYQFTPEETGPGKTELFLFSHEVLKGQSGAPVLSADSRGVVGLIEGRWLHSAVVQTGNTEQLTPTQGAAVPIHYAISLLQQKGVAWSSTSNTTTGSDEQSSSGESTTAESFTLPASISVVAPPYPPDALMGGDVLVDAVVKTSGNLANVQTVHGDPPFVDVSLSAARTWSFSPARSDGQTVENHIGVVFEFPQPYMPKVTRKTRNYDEPLPNAADRGALPLMTVEPEYPAATVAEGSVILSLVIDAHGKIAATRVLQDVPALTQPALVAVRQWHFAPGKRAGTPARSAVIVVITFVRPPV
jgi:outer membrane biosynthesis protein TonB